MIDVADNRRAQKYSGKTQIARILWALARPLFVLSPRPLWGWRRFLLRLFGARVGRGVHIYPTVRITMPWNLTIGDQSAVGDRALLYNLGQLSIGERVTISHQAHLCGGSHDYRASDFPLIKASISILDSAWICADAFIGPGVTIGANAIVAARAVVTKNVEVGVIVAGNPAKPIAQREGTHS